MEVLVIYGLVVFIGGVYLGSSIERWATQKLETKDKE